MKTELIKLILAVAVAFGIIIAGLMWWFDDGFDSFHDFCTAIADDTPQSTIKQHAAEHGYRITHSSSELRIQGNGDFERATCIVTLNNGRSTASHYQLTNIE